MHVCIYNALMYLHTSKYAKVLQNTFKYYKYMKYIAWYSSISTSTMVTFKRYLSTSTSIEEHVIKCT